MNFWKFLIFLRVTFPKYQNSKPSKWLKWQFLTLWNQSKLMSPKIRVAGKLPNSHTFENAQLGSLGLYFYQKCKNWEFFIYEVFMVFFVCFECAHTWKFISALKIRPYFAIKVNKTPLTQICCQRANKQNVTPKIIQRKLHF